MTRLKNRTTRLRNLEELLLLTPDGMAATEVATQLDVDRRTIYRDLEFLDGQGVPVWQVNGRFGINRTRYLATVRLNFHESIALVLAGLLLSRTIDKRNPHVIAALRKLAVTLPRPFTEHLRRAAERVQSQNEGQQQVDVLEALAEGWGTGCKVKLDYRSPRSGKLRKRVISPYALEPTPSGIYVIGFDEWAKDIRTFKLDRLEKAAVSSERFSVPDSFDLEKHLATSWGIMAGETVEEVVLRFTPTVTPHVYERQWHPSQTLEKREDGGCTLRLQIAQPKEMQPWIRGWGAQVEVLAPGWLRADIAAEMRAAAVNYYPDLKKRRD